MRPEIQGEIIPVFNYFSAHFCQLSDVTSSIAYILQKQNTLIVHLLSCNKSTEQEYRAQSQRKDHHIKRNELQTKAFPIHSKYLLLVNAASDLRSVLGQRTSGECENTPVYSVDPDQRTRLETACEFLRTQLSD